MSITDLFLILLQAVFVWLALGALLGSVLPIPTRTISQFLKWGCVNFTIPVMIFSTVLSNLKDSGIFTILPYALGAFVFIAFSYFVSLFAGPRLHIKTHAITHHLGNSYHNYGFLAYGLVHDLLGADHMPMLFVFVLVCEFSLWTWGVHKLMPGTSSPAKALLSPPALALILGAICAKLWPSLQEQWAFTNVLKPIAQIAVPTALIALGGLLSHTAKTIPWKSSLTTRELWWPIVYRHLLFPTFAIIAICLCTAPESMLRNILLVQAIMPMALMTVTLTSIYNGDHKSLGLCVCVSMLLCPLSIPLWLFIMQALHVLVSQHT